LAAIARRIAPFSAAGVVRPNDTLRKFVWRASGVHQFYVGAIAVLVALTNFVPIDLQRRIVDIAIDKQDINALFFYGGLYLGAMLLYAGLKYGLMVYQGWVGESTTKSARDQLAAVAAERAARGAAGQTANIIGNEIDAVGGFVGTSISEFVVNITLLLSIASYMLYVQPVIALVSAVCLIPQVGLALYMQGDLNVLVERQVSLVRRLGNEAIVHNSARSKLRQKVLNTIRTIFSNRIELYLLKFGLKTLLNIAGGVGALSVLMVGGYLVIEGQTTLGTVVAFVTGFQRLSDPLGELLDFYRVSSTAKVQYRLIVRWVDDNGG
jgi:ABC-type multidrug transport system fused ATPase/permease subunit